MYINKKKDRDAFYLQNIKKNWAVFLYFDSFHSLILADNLVIYLSFVNHLKYIAVTAQLLQ